MIVVSKNDSKLKKRLSSQNNVTADKMGVYESM